MRTWLPFVAYLTAYALLHSVLAAESVKRWAADCLGSAFAGYRFAYVVVSCALLIPLLWLPHPEGTLYRIDGTLAILLRATQALGAAGFLWTLGHFDTGQFLGLTQLRTGITDDRDEHAPLSASGPFRLCRHPLYVSSALILVANPDMNHTSATFTLWCLAYFLIGSAFEENRLLALHGEPYRLYQQATPRFIPTVFPGP